MKYDNVFDQNNTIFNFMLHLILDTNKHTNTYIRTSVFFVFLQDIFKQTATIETFQRTNDYDCQKGKKEILLLLITIHVLRCFVG